MQPLSIRAQRHPRHARPARAARVQLEASPPRPRSRRRTLPGGPRLVALAGLLAGGLVTAGLATAGDAADASRPQAGQPVTRARASLHDPVDPAAGDADASVARPSASPADGAPPAALGPGERVSADPLAALAPAGQVVVGSWSIDYVPGPDNGDGANIELPLRALDGQVLRPGGTFDFWSAVGEVSRRAGYRLGAVVVGDRIVPQGALAGGICLVSTAVFDAALRAGLEIDARSSHGVYLDRYPLGLDAAVAITSAGTTTLRFRNDTGVPITIRTVSDPGVAVVALVAPRELGRIVELGEPVISHRVHAGDVHVATRSLPRGTSRRTQAGSDGMTVTVSRSVRDTDGTTLHHDTFVSHYRPLLGRVEVGTG